MTRLLVFDQITVFIRKPFHEIIEETLEDGQVETYLRVKGSGIRYLIGELLSCYWCVGIWSSLALFISYQVYPTIFMPIIVILAIAAVASIIEVMISNIIG